MSHNTVLLTREEVLSKIENETEDVKSFVLASLDAGDHYVFGTNPETGKEVLVRVPQ